MWTPEAVHDLVWVIATAVVAVYGACRFIRMIF